MATILSGWMGLRQNIVAMSQGYKLHHLNNVAKMFCFLIIL